MKVVIVDPSLFTWPYDLELCKAVGRQGADSIVVGPCQPEHRLLVPHYYPELRGPVVRLLPRPLFLAAKGVSHIRGNSRLVRRLAVMRPDVIHFQWLPLPLVDIGLLRRLRDIAPLVLTVHDTVPFNGSPRSSLQAWGFRRALNLFDALIVHTEQGRGRMISVAGSPDKVHVIPHGLPALEPSNEAVTPPSGVGGCTFLMFGKIKPYKGVDVLIEAVARLKSVLPATCRFRIVGEPFMDIAPLIRRTRLLGVDRFFSFDLRRIEDGEMGALFRAASALLFPYREIEASGVLMNALEHGRPVIASRLGAFAEYLSDGQDALLVPPGDPSALALAIQRFVSEPALRNGLANGIVARRRQLPDWDEVARRTAQLYRSLRAEREWARSGMSAAGCATPGAPETPGASSG